MVTLNDQYIPIEGINFSFTEIENCELEARPTRIWFKWKDFWFRKRDWVITDELRETKWNLKASSFFNEKILSYTDDWFVYDFDWTAMQSIAAVPAATITQANGNTDLNINANTPLTKQWQEFTTTQDGVIRFITIRMKAVGSLPWGTFVRCRITTAADKSTVIATSQTIVAWWLIWATYADYTFQFNNFYTPTATQYFFYVEADATDNTNYIQIQAQTANPYAWWASYNFNWSVWAVNGTTDFRFIVNSTGRLYYDSRFSEDTTTVSYLWWGRYPDSTVTRVVNTYNNTTWVMTFTVALPGAVWDFVLKYVYVDTWTGRQQYSIISTQASSTSITAWQLFATDPVPWDTVVFYNSIEPQVLMPQLRRGSGSGDVWFLYSYTRWGYNNFWNFSTSKKLVFWDWRLVSLTLDWQNLAFQNQLYIEVAWLDTVSFWNEAALDIADFWAYLMCFFKNKIWVVRWFTNTTTNTTTYKYQDLASIWLYSAKSYLIKGSDLYIFSSDKILYSVDISTLTINELSSELKDQWEILENYFDAFREWGEVTFNFSSGILRLVYKFNGATEVYKYIENYKVWVRDTYTFAGNFLSWLYNINDKKVSLYENQFVQFSWIQDLWINIVQKIKIYWPEEWKMSTFTLLKTKLRIWFDYINKIWWRVMVQIWWYKLTNRYFDLKDIDVIQEINWVIDSKWLIGEAQIAQFIIWWELFSTEQLKLIYPEIIDVWFNVWRKWQYFTMEITNDEEKQLYLNVINPIYNTESQLVISNKWVIPWT